MTGSSSDPRVAGARLAVWSPGVPHPSEGASTVLFWHYIAGLRRAGFDVLNILLLQSGDSDAASVERYRESTADLGIAVAVVSSADGFLVERRHAVRVREEPLGPALAAAGAFRPDATLCLDLVAAWAARETVGPRVVWLGDLRFQTLWYHALYAASEQRRQVGRLPLALISSLAWRRAYREALDGAAAVVVSSKSSERALARLGVPAEYQPYPWPAPPPAEDAAEGALGLPTFVFLGTLQALGSRSAFHFLLGRLYPKLVQRWGKGGFRVLIAGRGGLPEWAATALKQTPELEHVGFVDDLTGLLRQAHAAIAPISVPVGNRSRILTALAAEAVVVAHENAALGNPDLVDGITCYLSGNAAEFAERMARCVDDPAAARHVAARGRELYLTRFSPDIAVGTAVDTLASVLPSVATRALERAE